MEIRVSLCCSILGSILQAVAALPRFSGAAPPWTYCGFESFPSHYFGANGSGLENAERLELAAKHHVAGWGWQQNYHTVGRDEGHIDGPYYQQETSLAQMASRFAAFLEFSPPRAERRTQGIFVYRHLESALFFFQVSAAAYHDPANREMFLHDAKGHVCWHGGPVFNFSSPRATQWILDEVAGDLLRQANVQAVFFDETDWLYCGGPPGNCSHSIADEEGWKAQYRAKIQMLRQLALKLNAGGIWPIYSTFNGFTDTPYRKCVVPYDEYYTALHDVGWFRFYEFGIGAQGPEPGALSQAPITQALKESELGQPVIVHASPHQGSIKLPLALFLLAQNEWWYFGASTGWFDKDWNWWGEYDAQYGAPLGPAKSIGSSGWQRAFTNCTVFVSSDLTTANITFNNGSSMVTEQPNVLI